MFRNTLSILHINDQFFKKDNEIPGYSHYIIQQLNNINVDIKKYVYLRDCENVACELESLFKQFDVVLVICKLHNNQQIFQALSSLCSKEIVNNGNVCEKTSETAVKIPLGARLIESDSCTGQPVVHMQGIFFINEENLETSFKGELKQYLIRLNKSGDYVKLLKIQMNGKTRQVIEKIGNDNDVKVSTNEIETTLFLTIQSNYFEKVVNCENIVREELCSGLIESSIATDDAELLYSNKQSHVKKAIQDIEDCLVKFGPQHVFLSFNGGKDCTVLLHLVCTILKEKYPNYKRPTVCLYVTSKSPFPEQDQFIAQCKVYYNLEVITIASDIKFALNNILEGNRNLLACFMGTRRTDPYSDKLKVFQMTDSDWPQVMRVNPLLDWHYSDIWDYLIYFKVPYCELYDRGYTSLGNALNTIRNPSLRIRVAGSDEEQYLPAYKLLNETNERYGRNKVL